MNGIRSKNFLKFWFPVILYSGIIFCISALPKVEVPFAQFNLDKLIHGIEYAVLGYLFSRAATKTSGLSRQNVLWATAVFCMVYGLSDELHQWFVPGRDAALGDVLADTIGGTIGGLINKK